MSVVLERWSWYAVQGWMEPWNVPRAPMFEWPVSAPKQNRDELWTWTWRTAQDVRFQVKRTRVQLKMY